MKTIVKMIFGSHLYGTDTASSDKDYKGVFMPSKEQIYLGRIPKSFNETTGHDDSKNNSNDIDTEIYSLHYFIQLACEGQTVALDMLHTPKSKIIESSPLWEQIVLERDKFYTKNLRAFVGYCRRQASKYGIKGSRLENAKSVLDYLKQFNEYEKLKNVWDNLPKGEHIHKMPADDNGVRMYQVCGKKLGETCELHYVIDVLEKFYESYGKRALMAMENKGIDWKAISHAFRAAYETKQLLTENIITFPLKNAKFVRDIKEGKYHYQDVNPQLEKLIDEVEELSNKSDLPEKVNRKYWNKFLINEVEYYLNRKIDYDIANYDSYHIIKPKENENGKPDN
jgi:hypothetical protein